MNEETNQELHEFNKLFEININNNLETTDEELSQKNVRIRNAIDYLQYKKQHFNLSQEEIEAKFIETYGKEKALQIISDAEDVKRVALIETANRDKLVLHKLLNKYSQIIDMIIGFKQQHPDIPDKKFNKKLRVNGYDDSVIRDLINLKEKEREQKKAENQGLPRL